MTPVGIISGSGLAALDGLEAPRQARVATPYGEASAPLVYGRFAGCEVIFLPRHGSGHTIPPHEINYRANLWALEQAGAQYVIAVNAVGAIRPDLAVPSLVIPDQIIDYTYGREHTFFDHASGRVTHVDFTEPYCERLRQVLIAAAANADLPLATQATYAATEGPRFESAAEIRRFERDGADIVGMTGMPEASLARELDLCYASIAVVANPAAGKIEGGISLETVEKNLSVGMAKLRAVLEQAVQMVAVSETRS